MTASGTRLAKIFAVFRKKFSKNFSGEEETGRISENDPLLILGAAGYYQRELLFRMYSKPSENHNWTVCAELKKHYLYQMATFLPPPGDPSAPFENYTPEGRQHDLFDCNKMTYTLHDFALAVFGSGFFRKPVSGAEISDPVILPPERPVHHR